MRILAIESSCDETAVAVLTGEGEMLTLESSLVRSQIDIHAVYGGVVPEVAAREHLEMLFPMIHRSVGHDGAGIDAIAVTSGPGLAPALRVGVEAAKALAVFWNKPLVPVCHLEGHIYAAWLSKSKVESRKSKVDPEFPALALIVSGGHSELVYMTGHGKFERLGETLDDAAGEAFDKVAKMLGLGYPGGPKVAALSEGGDPKAFAFPRAMLKDGSFNFSFSGLKTSVLYTLRKEEARINDEKFRKDIAASFQEAVVDVLVQKTRLAVEKTGGVKSIILAGGVAANLALRDRLTELGGELSIPIFLPPFEYSLDNAAMIAAAGYFRAKAGDFADPLTLSVDPNMDIV